MAKSVGTGRERGHIRKRGNSYQVLLYAGVDPLTGRELRMVESTTDRAEATRILNRMRARAEAQQHARTRATLGAALDAWLRARGRGDDSRRLPRIRPALHQAGARQRPTLEGHRPAVGGVLRRAPAVPAPVPRWSTVCRS
ncbi:MAG: hypothetical protein LC808_29070 [Actinobacteria bacterium]|nr:hypothetical protein [Actinomycetota bacterium]